MTIRPAVKAATQADWIVALPAGYKLRGGELTGECPDCGGNDRFRVKRDGWVFCRVCCRDGSPAALVNLRLIREIIGLESAGTRCYAPEIRFAKANTRTAHATAPQAVAASPAKQAFARQLFDLALQWIGTPVVSYMERRKVLTIHHAPPLAMRWLTADRYPTPIRAMDWHPLQGANGRLIFKLESAGQLVAVKAEALTGDGQVSSQVAAVLRHGIGGIFLAAGLAATRPGDANS